MPPPPALSGSDRDAVQKVAEHFEKRGGECAVLHKIGSRSLPWA